MVEKNRQLLLSNHSFAAHCCVGNLLMSFDGIDVYLMFNTKIKKKKKKQEGSLNLIFINAAPSRNRFDARKYFDNAVDSDAHRLFIKFANASK